MPFAGKLTYGFAAALFTRMARDSQQPFQAHLTF